eukprot:1425896-Rhodomonas_salina.3
MHIRSTTLTVTVIGSPPNPSPPTLPLPPLPPPSPPSLPCASSTHSHCCYSGPRQGKDGSLSVSYPAQLLVWSCDRECDWRAQRRQLEKRWPGPGPATSWLPVAARRRGSQWIQVQGDAVPWPALRALSCAPHTRCHAHALHGRSPRAARQSSRSAAAQRNPQRKEQKRRKTVAKCTDNKCACVGFRGLAVDVSRAQTTRRLERGTRGCTGKAQSTREGPAPLCGALGGLARGDLVQHGGVQYRTPRSTRDLSVAGDTEGAHVLEPALPSSSVHLPAHPTEHQLPPSDRAQAKTSGCRMQGPGLKGVGCRVQGVECRVWGPGSRV